MAMTQAMKNFLKGRGITAIAIADRMRLAVHRDIYGMLCGRIKPMPELHDVLCGIYGMTEAEYREAIPERRDRDASSGTNHHDYSSESYAGGKGEPDGGTQKSSR